MNEAPERDNPPKVRSVAYERMGMDGGLHRSNSSGNKAGTVGGNTVRKKRAKVKHKRRYSIGDVVRVPRYGNAKGLVEGYIDQFRKPGTSADTKEERILPHGPMYQVDVAGRKLDSEPLWESELEAIG